MKPVTIKNFPKKAEEKAKAGELVAPMRYVYDPEDRSPVLSERLGSRQALDRRGRDLAPVDHLEPAPW